MLPIGDELIGRFQLDPSKRVRAYSKGNRQKVLLIAALSSRADLLILVEPTTGLDPLMDGNHLRCQVTGEVEPLLGVLAASGVHQLLSREPSLEELFLAHDGRELTVGPDASHAA
jgi:ABC-2 type transport system ATP-binding protein